MCVAVAKYFKDRGWIIAKNRDQDYVSTVSFVDEDHHKVGEIMYLRDHDIDYREGMNYQGMTIITTSLTPVLSLETNKKDGDNIYHALELHSPEAAAKYLVDQKMTGFIFIATPQKLILVEAAKEDDGRGEYHFTQRVVPKSEVVVRTNHGIDFPWAGFQYGVDAEQDMWRKSSEMRKKYAEKAIAKAEDPVSMLDALASKMDDDLQMNVFRIENKPRQMRTIFQWALVPSEDRVYIRPIQCKMKVKIDFEKIHVRMVDNEPIKLLYDGRVKHFCKIGYVENGHYLKTTQVESFQYYMENLKTIA